MAKATIPTTSASQIDAQNTQTADLTSPGTALGTVPYMSPEQVRAKELDARSDLFSFGTVLYEMATGQLPFRGESSGVIFDGIMNRTPVAPVRLNPDLPPKLEDIINKALEKDRNLRYQGAAEMRSDLMRLKRDTETGRAGVASSNSVAVVRDAAAPQSGAPQGVPSDLELLKQAKHSRLLRGWPLLTSLVVLTIALAFFVIFLLRAKQIQRGVEIVQLTALPGFEFGPSFSPDGSQIVFTANPTGSDNDIYVKAIGDEKTLRLTQPPGNSACPNWSPEGRTIAYRHQNEVSPGKFESAVFLMTPFGGAKHQIRQVSDSSSCITSWSPDAKTLAYDDKPPGENSGIFLMPLTGSPAVRMTTAPDTMLDGSPAFSPDGKQIAFVRSTDEGGRADLYLVSVLGREERKLTSLNRAIGSLTWTADGKRIIFAATGFFAGESACFR